MRGVDVAAAAAKIALVCAMTLVFQEASSQQSRQHLQRVGDIAFGTSFADARENSDALIGIGYATWDRRVLKTLGQTRVTLFGTAFNLTYVFGRDDRLTRVFGSVMRVMVFDKSACLEKGADLYAATVREFGSPDADKPMLSGRAWRFDFADGRSIRLRYYFGGILDTCSIMLDSTTPEGRDDHV